MEVCVSDAGKGGVELLLGERLFPCVRLWFLQASEWASVYMPLVGRPIEYSLDGGHHPCFVCVSPRLLVEPFLDVERLQDGDGLVAGDLDEAPAAFDLGDLSSEFLRNLRHLDALEIAIEDLCPQAIDLGQGLLERDRRLGHQALHLGAVDEDDRLALDLLQALGEARVLGRIS